MNNKLLSLKPLVLAAMLLLSATAAQAGITFYTSQSAFNAAISAPGVDTFDDLSVMRYTSPMSRTAGAYSYTVSSVNDLYGAGLPGDHWLSNNNLLDPIVFSGFSGGVTAFGGNFFGSDINGMYMPNTSVTLLALDGYGNSISYTINNTTMNSFLGFVFDSPLASVTLTSGGTYWPTANNLTLGVTEVPANVPEPGTFSLLLGGVAALGYAARRRRMVR
ncbi:PEP-CTERM sorting domain-containing protein [Massilia horti]|uniref:PEP-CTERM sorting domain-containing protein n=1 Tax=Massilia horti TaxID=2562153 RepID=A0A4Y9T1X4_9BURK|nr:PEP-CTERM sorting domain-containing protein [Massilia horti]TFW31000.1 PEP-CTERM sorting domain-containing protein [Massilia horti]